LEHSESRGVIAIQQNLAGISPIIQARADELASQVLSAPGNLDLLGIENFMPNPQSLMTARTLLSPACHHPVLIISSDYPSITAIHEALTPLPKQLTRAINHGELSSLLDQAYDFRLVFIDDAHGAVPADLMTAIQSRWPGAAIILLSNDLQHWIEFIQKGAYDVLPKPVDGTELGWIAAGALLRQSVNIRNGITNH